MTLRNEPDASFPEEEYEPYSGPPKAPAAERLADALQSQLIRAFETAIDQGMKPADALAVMLSWMSSEMARIESGRQARPAR
jgi:hypothetical protein